MQFCPWVFNSVGFYNKKFFVQFCVYAALACSYAGLLLFLAFQSDTGVQRHSREIAGPKYDLLLSATAIVGGIFDAIFALVMCGFSGFHVYMVANNQTSIEDGRVSAPFCLDDAWDNAESVFGSKEKWRWWWVPLWMDGPIGDGVHWRTPNGGVVGHAKALKMESA